jgi:hypothetical protein
MSKLDFNDEEEKKLVESVFNNAIDSLSEDDKKLPQIEHILPLLKVQRSQSQYSGACASRVVVVLHSPRCGRGELAFTMAVCCPYSRKP